MDFKTFRYVAVASLLTVAAADALMSGGANAQATDPTIDDATVLHLTQSAQRTVRQDRLSIELRVEASGVDPARVQATINRRMAAGLEAAHAMSGVEAETRGYSVRQERPANGPMRWVGAQGLALHGGDAASLLKLAGELQQNGFVMSGMVYDVTPATANSLEDELTAEALARLRDRVTKIADEMKLELRNFKNLQVGNVSGGPRPLAMMRAVAAPAGAPPPSAQAGESTLEVTVSADVVMIPRGTAPP